MKLTTFCQIIFNWLGMFSSVCEFCLSTLLNRTLILLNRFVPILLKGQCDGRKPFNAYKHFNYIIVFVIVILRNYIMSFDSSKWRMAAVLTGRMNYAGMMPAKFQILKVMMIRLFLLHIQRTYVILHVRNATVNQRARGQADSHARRKGAIVLLVADASLRLACVKIDQERQQYMEEPKAARATVG